MIRLAPKLKAALVIGTAAAAFGTPAFAAEPPLVEDDVVLESDTDTTLTDSYTTEGAVIAAEPNEDVASDVETYGLDEDGLTGSDLDEDDDEDEDDTSDSSDMGESDWPMTHDADKTDVEVETDVDVEADPLD